MNSTPKCYDPFGYPEFLQISASNNQTTTTNVVDSEMLDYQMKDMESNLFKIMDSEREMAVLAAAAGFTGTTSLVQNQNLFSGVPNKLTSSFNSQSNVLRPITNNPNVANRRLATTTSAANELKTPNNYMSCTDYFSNSTSSSVDFSPEEDMRILKLRNRTVTYNQTTPGGKNSSSSIFSPTKRPIETTFSPPSKMKISDTIINLNAFSPNISDNTNIFINPQTPEMPSNAKDFLSPSSSSIASLSPSNSTNNLNMLFMDTNSNFIGSFDQNNHLLPPSSLNTTTCSITSSPIIYNHLNQSNRHMQTRSQTRGIQNMSNNNQMNNYYGSSHAHNNNSNNYNLNNKKSIKMSVPSSKRQVLEEEFRKEKYPSNEKLQKLSTKLNMRYDEVQNYFKKRRREEKETNHKFSNLVKLLNNYLEQED